MVNSPIISHEPEQRSGPPENWCPASSEVEWHLELNGVVCECIYNALTDEQRAAIECEIWDEQERGNKV